MIKLPSGAKLEITIAPFKDARALYQALLEEVKSLKMDPEAEVDVNLWKDLFCAALSSKKIEAALDVCMARALYNGVRISDETFEKVEAREDYIDACYEVAKANIQPFTKSLYVKYSHILGKLKVSPT